MKGAQFYYGSQTDRDKGSLLLEEIGSKRGVNQQVAFKEGVLSPTMGAQKYSENLNAKSMRELKKSMSNQELIKSGALFGLNHENLLLLKNAPRP